MSFLFLALSLAQPQSSAPFAQEALANLGALPAAERTQASGELADAFIERGDCKNALTALGLADGMASARAGTIKAAKDTLPCAEALVEAYVSRSSTPLPSAMKRTKLGTRDAGRHFEAYALYVVLDQPAKAAEHKHLAMEAARAGNRINLEGFPPEVNARLQHLSDIFSSVGTDPGLSALGVLAGSQHYGPVFDEFTSKLRSTDRKTASEYMNSAADAGDLARAESLQSRLELAPTWRLFEAYWKRGERETATALISLMKPDERGLPFSTWLQADPAAAAEAAETLARDATPDDHSTYFIVASASAALADLASKTAALELATLAFDVTPKTAPCPVQAAETLARLGASLPRRPLCVLEKDTLRGYAQGAAVAGRWKLFETALASLDARARTDLFKYLPFASRRAPEAIQTEIGHRLASEIASLTPDSRGYMREKVIPDTAGYMSASLAFELVQTLTPSERWTALDRAAYSLNANGKRAEAIEAARQAERAIDDAPDPTEASSRAARLWAMLGQPYRAVPHLMKLKEAQARMEPLIKLVRYAGTDGFRPS